MYKVIYFGGGSITTLRNLYKKLSVNGYIIFENLHYESTKRLIRKFIAQFYNHLYVIGIYGYNSQFIVQKRN